MPDIAGITYNLTLADAPGGIVQGYNKAQRDGLADDTLIKVRKEAVKCNLPARLTKGLQVTTFDPANLKSNSNFFNFVTQWETTVNMIKEHINTFYMQSSFHVVKREITVPEAAVMETWRIQNALFDVQHARYGGGDPNSYTIPAVMAADGVTVVTPDVTYNRPGRPATVTDIVEVAPNLLDSWQALTLEQVVESVKVQLRYVEDPVYRQNLAWSYEYLQNCLDYDMGQYALAQISRLDPQEGRTGPVLFMIVAQRLVQTTENLAMKVINGLIALRLTHFDSESVPECVFTLRNVLKFLRYGENDSFAPRTTVELVYDVFRGSSVPAFRNYVQQVQDITLGRDANPEAVFDKMQSKYEELLLSDRWVPKKKTTSAFFAGNTTSYEDAEKEKRPHSNSNGRKNQKGKSTPKTHDKSGKKIDRTPPKSGEPHKREVNGETEHWCDTCGRWGSHPTKEHDSWLKKFREDMKKKNKIKSSEGSSANSSRTNKKSVSFAGALRSGLIAHDPQLSDGIDLDS